MVLYYKNLKIKTNGKVYRPAEDSLLLADNIDAAGSELVADIGTGTGIQALVAAQKAKRVIATDINQDAIELAKNNASVNGLSNIVFRLGSLFENLPGKFDLILFNPPYLPVNDEDALGMSWSGGKSGMRVIKSFLKGVGDYLNPNGRFLFIVSSLNKPEGLLKKYRLMDQRKLSFEELYLLEGGLHI